MTVISFGARVDALLYWQSSCDMFPPNSVKSGVSVSVMTFYLPNSIQNSNQTVTKYYFIIAYSSIFDHFMYKKEIKDQSLLHSFTHFYSSHLDNPLPNAE